MLVRSIFFESYLFGGIGLRENQNPNQLEQLCLIVVLNKQHQLLNHLNHLILHSWACIPRFLISFGCRQGDTQTQACSGGRGGGSGWPVAAVVLAGWRRLPRLIRTNASLGRRRHPATTATTTAATSTATASATIVRVCCVRLQRCMWVRTVWRVACGLRKWDFL